MSDVLGNALLDFYNGNYTEDIITETSVTEEDELPLPYLFRSFKEMPPLEQKALQLAKGKVLDVGCGAGSHALYLQQKKHPITAIDISKGAIEVSKKRGVIDARKIDLLELNNEQFDTILLLMNGTGVFQKLEQIDTYLNHLKKLLSPKGQILIDSSDLQYLYPEGQNGGIWVPQDHYYGELEFTMSYKGETTEPFNWLYLDQKIFKEACDASNLSFEVIAEGTNFDYLARLTAL
ncbi:class I SAM-dependent methyltransferase [Patiriisocius hiemis]|uniref:Class I SAM-dependent methyltransferase n=1 Tax=Patiriisocius hiemis TaxID=3075604 RepID=A0ABU2YET3_9FLAO|nr:class I SAM-dependent methyltransferase [Constantimarinum sp. W242]MDT0556703.1 class I SAM-dependent methyltransferase [Constantimarinum sp. W242]